jgi:hypothetical protein
MMSDVQASLFEPILNLYLGLPHPNLLRHAGETFRDLRGYRSPSGPCIIRWTKQLAERGKIADTWKCLHRVHERKCGPSCRHSWERLIALLDRDQHPELPSQE